MAQPDVQTCQLTAHLNETNDPDTGAALKLPRWYDLHYRLLRLLTDRVGCRLTVVASPWPRSLALLESGHIDLMLTMSYTQERAKFADFIGVHYLEETVLVLDKQWRGRVKKLEDVASLPGYIGVLRDAWYGPLYHQLEQEPDFKHHLMEAGSLTQKLNLLQRGRVLGTIEDRSQFLEWSQLYPELGAQYEIVLSLQAEPVYIAASIQGVPAALRQEMKAAWHEIYGGPEHLKILAEFGWRLP